MTDQIEQVRKRVDEQGEAIDRLGVRVSAIETSSAVEEVHRLNISNRLQSIEDTLKWLVRLIIGGLLVAIVGFAVNGGFNVI